MKFAVGANVNDATTASRTWKVAPVVTSPLALMTNLTPSGAPGTTASSTMAMYADSDKLKTSALAHPTSGRRMRPVASTRSTRPTLLSTAPSWLNVVVNPAETMVATIMITRAMLNNAPISSWSSIRALPSSISAAASAARRAADGGNPSAYALCTSDLDGSGGVTRVIPPR
jgi:hypothetical protein